MNLDGKTILITGGTRSFGKLTTNVLVDHRPPTTRGYSRDELKQSEQHLLLLPLVPTTCRRYSALNPRIYLHSRPRLRPHLSGPSAAGAHAPYLSSFPCPSSARADHEPMPIDAEDVRLTVLLRNPLDAAYALHQELQYNLSESVTDFQHAWGLHEGRREGYDIPGACREPARLQYRSVYHYAEQLSRLFDQVPAPQALVLLFNALAVNPQRVYERVLRFLDIESDGRRSFPRVNAAKALRSRRSLGRSRSAWPMRPTPGSSSGSATGCFTSQGGPPATPDARRCVSPTTGAGQGSSPPHSRACRRSQPRPADRRRLGAHLRPRPSAAPPASACAQTTPQSSPARPSHRQTRRMALPAAFTATADALRPCSPPGQPLTASGPNQTLAARSRPHTFRPRRAGRSECSRLHSYAAFTLALIGLSPCLQGSQTT